MLNKIFGKFSRIIPLVAATALILLMITGCASGPGSEKPAAAPESRLAYVTADGFYMLNLINGKDGARPDGAASLISAGAGFVSPVFSGDGSKVLFKQMKDQNAETGALQSTLFAHDFENGQTVRVMDDPVSYSAGPDGSFLVSTEAGQLMRVTFGTGHDSALVPKTEELQLWPEVVPKEPQVSIQYENLKSSPDFKYLAYDVMVKDDRPNSRPEGFGPYYSGGLYVLNCETGETAMVVEPIKADENRLGNQPEPGPWSPNGKTLFIWDQPMAASLNADGVNGFFYHADTGEKTRYDQMLLNSDKNISYSDVGTAAVLSGGGREMFSGKNVDLLTDYSASSAVYHPIESITEKGLVPAMPQLSADGHILYFAGVDKNSIGAYPLKRQLYSLKVEEPDQISQITTDPDYRNESPVLLKNQKDLIFGRGSAAAYDGKMEIWMTSVDGKNQVKLAEWMEPDSNDALMSAKYDDYYGRGSWNNIFAIYDVTD